MTSQDEVIQDLVNVLAACPNPGGEPHPIPQDFRARWQEWAETALAALAQYGQKGDDK